jgi:anti-sigma regulatory factor (Ser/Thr protein kinase)
VLDTAPLQAGTSVSCYRISARAVPAGDVVESMDHLHLDPVPRVVGEARSFMRDHAPALPEPLLDVLLLLTSELVTNAVIHARTPLEVGITVTDRSLIVTVHDEDLGNAPERDGREGGWGLGLVRQLADDSDMEQHVGEGKTAWFRIGRARREPAA